MLQAFKKPYLSTVKLLEKFGNKKSKLIKVNLNEFFNNTENIKNALELSLEEIICKKAGNDGILNKPGIKYIKNGAIKDIPKLEDTSKSR